MKTLIFLTILALIGCDNSKNYSDTIDKPISDSSIIMSTTNIYDTTLVNNNNKFVLTTKPISTENTLLNVSFNNQTTTLDTLYYNALAYIKYLDFDNDGNTDILVDYIGNNSTYFLFLFDPSSNSFKGISNYLSFPGSIPLKSCPNLYYSYRRAGCADDNWVSDLIQFKNFEIIHLGHIDGEGCSTEISKAIKIYKVTHTDEQKLIQRLNYDKTINDSSDKWVFIEKYWNKNYKKFN